MMLYLRVVATLLILINAPYIQAASQVFTNDTIRVIVDVSSSKRKETMLVKTGESWVEALTVQSSSVRVRTDTGMQACEIMNVTRTEHGLLLHGDCGVGTFEQRVDISSEKGVLYVSTKLNVKHNVVINSVEDRYDFAPARRLIDNERQGPLDFVWSQNIKSEADDLIPTNGFKSPVVMMQQGEVFAALMPKLNDRHVETVALDLNTTSDERPWMSYGAVPSQPHGHSYFKRDPNARLHLLADTVQYSYSIVLSREPKSLGYRRVVRRLWSELGHPELLRSSDMQENAVTPELNSFSTWRDEAWGTYADRVYFGFDCGGRHCGTLTSSRNVKGDWQHTEPDAWFNAWFQTLRTAYGWYLYGRQTHNMSMVSRAESVLNLALSAPQKDGAFPTIYLINQHKWIADDGWAGYADDYHAFCMSWTAYWMLRWAEDLTPQRKSEVLRFVKQYGDFLVQHQQESGVIPSWYEPASLLPRTEFRDFNAETAASALLLATLGKDTGDKRYLIAAERAMVFLSNEVIPRQRWFDFETFLSCARKDYDFYDRWTSQFPQNNLAEIQAPQAWLTLFQATGKRKYLERGTETLDYLLLTQQVWSNPAFTPNLLGGFTTQNTDAEWSDARQSYVAPLLLDYYRATSDFEYLERAIASGRSTFAVAPWENWAHTGYVDEPGALTGFHWGTGSAATSIEIMSPFLGDAFIDLKTEQGVGFDECTIRNVHVQATIITFHIESKDRQRTFVVRFGAVDPRQQYRISWNSRSNRIVSGRELLANGFKIGPIG